MNLNPEHRSFKSTPFRPAPGIRFFILRYGRDYEQRIYLPLGYENQRSWRENGPCKAQEHSVIPVVLRPDYQLGDFHDGFGA